MFFYDKYFTGTYIQHGDTLVLDYDTSRPIRFGDVILMDQNNQWLTTLRTEKDGLENVVRFYYGYCKGLN